MPTRSSFSGWPRPSSATWSTGTSPPCQARADTTRSRSSTIATPAEEPSPPNSRSSTGTTSSATPPSETPSSTLCSTTPTASLSRAARTNALLFRAVDSRHRVPGPLCSPTWDSPRTTRTLTTRRPKSGGFVQACGYLQGARLPGRDSQRPVVVDPVPGRAVSVRRGSDRGGRIGCPGFPLKARRLLVKKVQTHLFVWAYPGPRRESNPQPPA